MGPSFKQALFSLALATAFASVCIVCFAEPSVAQKSDVKSVAIYTQVWMSENLNIDRFRNGDLIPEAKSDVDWLKAGKEGKPAWCHYRNDPANGARYGRLYNSHAVTDKRGLAPPGWHISTSAEWGLLMQTLGSAASTEKEKDRTASRKLREKAVWQWGEPGTDDFGFTAKPGGMRGYDGSFSEGGSALCCWTRNDATFGTEKLSGKILTEKGTKFHSPGPSGGLSVRCVRDPNTWTAVNLSVDRFRNGEPIPQAKTAAEWEKSGSEGKPVCAFYSFDSACAERFGRIYNWYAVSDPRGLAPKGWHIPSDSEWLNLVNANSGRALAGGPLKSTTGWTNTDGHNTNSSGLGLLPGGYCNYQGLFGQMGHVGMFWTSSLTDKNNATAWIFPDKSTASDSKSIPMRSGASVRCVKD